MTARPLAHVDRPSWLAGTADEVATLPAREHVPGFATSGWTVLFQQYINDIMFR
jgi:hypothetical protein